MNYEDFISSIIKTCSLIDNPNADTDPKTLRMYLYRIAAYAVSEIRKEEQAIRQDEDYIDAVQDCTQHIDQLIASWRKSGMKVKLATYAQRSFTRIAARYLHINASGGMLRPSTRDFDDFPQITSLDALVPPEDEDGNESESDWNDITEYVAVPIGLAAPPLELERRETFDTLLAMVPTRRSYSAGQRLRHEIGTIRKGNENVM